MGDFEAESTMSYYTDKVYSSNFLSKSRGLDEMLVQDKSEERPPLPESRQARLEARMKETTTRDTSFTRTKKEPRETVLYLGPSRGGESDLRDNSRLNDIKRTQDSKANITVKSNRQLLEESSRSLNLDSDTSSIMKRRGGTEQQRHERDPRPMSMSRVIPSSGQRVTFKEESPSRPSSALSNYTSYQTTRRSVAPETLERRRDEKVSMSSTYSTTRRRDERNSTSSTYSSSNYSIPRRTEERDWLPTSSSSRLLVRGDQRSGVEIFSHSTVGALSAPPKTRRPMVDRSHYQSPKEEPAQYHTDRTFPTRFLMSNPGIEQMIVRRDSR